MAFPKGESAKGTQIELLKDAGLLVFIKEN